MWVCKGVRVCVNECALDIHSPCEHSSLAAEAMRTLEGLSVELAMHPPTAHQHHWHFIHRHSLIVYHQYQHHLKYKYKNCRSDFHESFTRDDVSLDKEVSVTLCNSSATGYAFRNFLNKLLQLWDTRSSADADKPARCVYTGYGFLLAFCRNFICNTHRFWDIHLQ